MSTRNISSGVKEADVGLTTLTPSCGNCLEFWEPESSGALRASPGKRRNCFTNIKMCLFVILKNSDLAKYGNYIRY